MKIVLILVLMLIATSGRSQVSTTELSYPDASTALDLIRSPAKTLFLATLNGIYRYDKASSQWAQSLAGGWKIKVGTLDQNLYASANGQLYVSTDEGINWKILEPSIDFAIMDFAIADSNSRMLASSPSDEKCRSYDPATKKYVIRPLKHYNR
jgi:hypothetical protein